MPRPIGLVDARLYALPPGQYSATIVPMVETAYQVIFQMRLYREATRRYGLLHNLVRLVESRPQPIPHAASRDFRRVVRWNPDLHRMEYWNLRWAEWDITAGQIVSNEITVSFDDTWAEPLSPYGR